MPLLNMDLEVVPQGWSLIFVLLTVKEDSA